MQNVVTVPFHADTVFAVERADGVYIALKPIADRLGLDWSAQYRRTKRDVVMARGIAVMAIPSEGGTQDALCLRLPLLPGWLFGIEVRRVRAECRAAVLVYQAECHEALFRHFYGVADRAPEAPDARREPLKVRRQIVTEARLIFGPRAAAALWRSLGLPDVTEMGAPPDQGALPLAPPSPPAP
ncbi:phage antirepressor N-terminal domain-containing protein [Methylobacterium sp. CCH5-D2]|uniref:phage antirepressor N-terminal domain-containing protein n=1 Tax=Methylobacterium sp. CCH5-D2 TaxID=1768765 RepID=UPI000833DD82|nr:phage antirepressor N-terminal domain-containing protein [Methylobacterium sp. CCH5-D2]